MAAPRITITSVIPGTSIPANTGRVEVSWSVSSSPGDGLSAVWAGYGRPGMEVLPDGVFTDWGSGASNVFPTTSESFISNIGRTYSVEIAATNDDGSADDREVLYSKIPVGYHSASLPGAPVKENDLRRIRLDLEEIDRRLNDNVLTNLPEYIAEWNRRVPEQPFPSFSDMAYLSGAVGSGNLADDILNAMRDVLIYIYPHTMPRGYRPGTITDPGRRALCERVEVDGESKIVVFGKSTREWVSICHEGGADDLTLLHELFHYASTSNNGDEARAFAVSLCAYNYFP